MVVINIELCFITIYILRRTVGAMFINITGKDPGWASLILLFTFIIINFKNSL